ncbi:FAD-dependent oxidoreductase [Hymenobacter humi]
MQLLNELGIRPFVQPSAGATAYQTPQGVHRLPHPSGSAGYLRFAGGAAVLCQTLAEQLPAECLHLNTRVTQLRRLPHGEGIEVHAAQGDTTRTYRAAAVVLALPPRLVAHRLAFEPALPASLLETLRAVPTWMSHAMKSVVVYPEPFWRAHGWSGFAVSRLGPLTEIHDASPSSSTPGVLFGFFAAPHPLRAAPRGAAGGGARPAPQPVRPASRHPAGLPRVGLGPGPAYQRAGRRAAACIGAPAGPGAPAAARVGGHPLLGRGRNFYQRMGPARRGCGIGPPRRGTRAAAVGGRRVAMPGPSSAAGPSAHTER